MGKIDTAFIRRYALTRAIALSKRLPYFLLPALLFASPGLAQAALPEVCAAATEKSPYVVSDGQGRLYSQLTLGTDFSAAALVPGLQELERRFRGLGIELVAVPVPWAAMIYFPDTLVGSLGTFGYLPSRARLGYQQVVSSFRQAGINTADLLTLFLAHQEEDLYFKTDHHWKRPAVELAARDITNLVPQAVKQVLADPDQPGNAAPVFQGQFEFQGGFAVDVQARCQVTFPLEKTFATVELPQTSQSLLSDEVPAGVIFGSSFSRSVTINQGTNPYALGYGFEQWLASLLHTSFQNESISSGSQTAMLEFFGQPTNATGRRLAIWEFPISDFAAANQDHNLTFLAQMMARLSRLAHPNEPLVAAGHPTIGKNTVDFAFDALPTAVPALYLRLNLKQQTSLSPILKIQGMLGEVQLDLHRDGSKLIQTEEFLVQVPASVGRLRQVTATFPASKDAPVSLEGSALSLFELK